MPADDAAIDRAVGAAKATVTAAITPSGETELSPVQAADRIEAFAREGRLVQDIWRGERRGREVACLLGAISERINDRRACPEGVMPVWVAHLLPDLHDNIPVELVGPFGVRFARALRRTEDWPAQRWRAVRVAWVTACVTGAMGMARPVLGEAAWWREAAIAVEAVLVALHAGDHATLRVARGIARAVALDTEKDAAWLAMWAASETDEGPARVAERAVELGEEVWAASGCIQNPFPDWADLYRGLLEAMEAHA